MSAPPPGRLKIAIVAPPWLQIPPPAYGGIESICAVLADGLVARGHDVTLFGAGTGGTAARFAPTFAEPQADRMGEALPELLHAATVAAALQSEQFDVVHDHTLGGLALADRRNSPTVVTAHGPVAGELGDYFRLLGHNLHFVAISDSQRAAAPQLPWAGRVHNAVRVADFPFRADKDDFVLFMGRCSPQKGLHTAIDVTRAAGMRLVAAAKCREPAEREYFETYVRPRLGTDVTWLAEVGGTAKLDLLAAARCLLFPIDWEEPFGMVMIEALACGTPVVALRRGSVSEVILDGVTGLIADKATELPELLWATSDIDPNACRADVAARFNAEEMVERYEAVYRRVAASST